jgi:hypothetical protein
MLQDRVSIPTRYSITVRDLARRPDLVRMLPDGDVQAVCSDCLKALDRLRARSYFLAQDPSSQLDGDTVVTQNNNDRSTSSCINISL